MKLTDMLDYSVKDGFAVLTIDNPPVNALSFGVRDGLKKGLDKATADDAVKGIVIICEGRGFIAGADLKEFDKRNAGGPRPGEITGAMENSSKPVICAIHGTALGGGLETALCAHFRVAKKGALFGLPEVNIGILPGAGGTQRLPRVVGVEKALQMIVSGAPIGVDEALEHGLIQETTDGDLLEAAIAFGRKALDEKRPLTRIRDDDSRIAGARGKPEIFADFRRSVARRTRGFHAPENCIKAVEACVNLPFDEGIKEEGRLFRELVTGPQSSAQRYAFFAERQVAKIPDVPADTPLIPVKKVGIIGAGTMGGGIAMNFANVGIPVTLVERDQKPLERGLGVIRKNYERSSKRGRFPMSVVEQRLKLIEGSLDFERLADCDLVIEAVFENMGIKKDIFAKLDGIVKDGAILASNTSALNINEIASVTKRPESVIGLHFFSPANVMRLLEIVRGDKTSKSVIATSMALAKKIKKVGVLVGVCRGFVGNRMLFARGMATGGLIQGGALPWDVDKVMVEFGFPMGPFAMSDLAGLDIGWNPDTSKGATLRERMCESGRRGQKNGKGYYNYDPETRVPSPAPEVEKMIREFNEEKGFAKRDVSEEEILHRHILPMVNEGAKILEEGIAIRSSDIDTIWLNGYGWPQYRGGPMYYADELGLDKVIEGMARLKEIDGGHPMWDPAPLLVKLAEAGKGFKDFMAPA